MFLCYSAAFCQLCFYNKRLDWIGLDWIGGMGQNQIVLISLNQPTLDWLFWLHIST